MEYNDENLLALDAQGLSYSEIAAQLGVTRGKVGARLWRIRKSGGDVLPRTVGRHPQGKIPDRKPKTNRYTIITKPAGYQSPTKSEMRMMLRQAVENTK